MTCTTKKLVDPIEAFEARCDARAYLWSVATSTCTMLSISCSATPSATAWSNGSVKTRCKRS
jgi:hypothetical protein